MLKFLRSLEPRLIRSFGRSALLLVIELTIRSTITSCLPSYHKNWWQQNRRLFHLLKAQTFDLVMILPPKCCWGLTQGKGQCVLGLERIRVLDKVKWFYDQHQVLGYLIIHLTVMKRRPHQRRVFRLVLLFTHVVRLIAPTEAGNMSMMACVQHGVRFHD